MSINRIKSLFIIYEGDIQFPIGLELLLHIGQQSKFVVNRRGLLNIQELHIHRTKLGYRPFRTTMRNVHDILNITDSDEEGIP